MFGVDGAAAGIGAFLTAVVGAISIGLKGLFDVVQDRRKDRQAGHSADQAHDLEARRLNNTEWQALIDNSRSDNAVLRIENARLREDNERLQKRVSELTDTVHEQGIRIAEMMERITDLEKRLGL